MSSHPALDALIRGDAEALAHAARCPACGELIALAGKEAGAATDEDFAALPEVARDVYTSWRALDGGGMGRAWTARDRRLRRVVAIKEIRADSPAADRAALARRLEQEARLTARLQHPSIIGVHEAGQWPSGEPFFAMPLVRGRPLDAEIALCAGPRERLALLPKVIAACEAIAYAHGEGIVHRDLKPSNIMVGDYGETVVIDWGLAKATGEPAASESPRGPTPDGMTRLGVGTPQYMPPEQARGEEPGPRVDVYALGATLYHLLAGVPPYGSDGGSARRKLLAGPPKPLVELVPDVAPALVAIVDKAMQREPQARFASARELAAELERFQSGQLTLTHSYTLGELVLRFVRRHRAPLAVASIAVIALVTGAVISAWRIVRERDRAEAGEAATSRQLASERGVTASRIAAKPERRLEAIALALQAVAGADPPEAARQGLFDAIDAGRAELVVTGAGGVRVGVSPDGTRFATAGIDRALWIVDARDGHAIAHVPTGVDRPWQTYFAPSGGRVLVCNYTFEPVLVDPATSAVVPLHGSKVAETCGLLSDGSPVVADAEIAVYTPDGAHVTARVPLAHTASSLEVLADDTIIVGDIDGGLSYWNRHDPMRRVMPHRGTVGSLTHVGDGVASSGWDGTIVRWDPPFRTSEPVVLGGGSEPFYVALVNTGRNIVGSHMVRAAEATRYSSLGVAIAGGDSRTLGLVVLSTDLRGGAVGAQPGEVEHLDADLETIERVAMPGDIVDDARAGLGGDRLAVSSRAGELALWDLRSGSSSGFYVGHTREITAMLSSQEGTLVTASIDGTVRTWSEPTSVLDVGSELLALEHASDGTLAALGLDGKVTLVRAGKVDHVLDGGGDLIGAARFSPDGTRLATAGHDGRVIVWDVRTGEPVITCDAGGRGLSAIAWSSDGSQLATGDRDGSARLWRAADCARLGALEIPQNEDLVGVARIELVGERVVIGYGGDHTVIARARDLSRERTISGRLVAPPLSDGKLVVATNDGDVAIADLATGERTPLGHHERPVSAAATSTTLIATGDERGQIFIHDRATHRKLRSVLTGPELPISALALSSDGRFVYAGYPTGIVRGFPIALPDAIARACATLASFGRACH